MTRRTPCRNPQQPVRLGVVLCILLMTLLLLPGAADAAVVTLKNGDQITGRIVKMEDNTLEIDSIISSDNVEVKWDRVKSIRTDRPMSVKLYSEVEIPENIGLRVRDRIILHSLEEGGPIRLEDVRSINLAEEDYRGYISLGGNQTTGNTKTQALNINGTLTFRREEHRFTLDGKYNRAQANNEDTANNGSFSVKYDYFLTRRLYLGGFNLTETDQFQNLSVRNTSGLGVGYDILDSGRQLLTVLAGPAGVYQDFTTELATLTPSTSWLVRYELRLFDRDVIFFHKQQGFKDLGHGSATRVNADQGIRIKIRRRWHLNLEYDLRYNSIPVSGRKTTDTNFIIGFSYDIKP